MVVFCTFALRAKTACTRCEISKQTLIISLVCCCLCTLCENSLHSLLQYLANENDIKKYFTFCHHPVGSIVQ